MLIYKKAAINIFGRVYLVDGRIISKTKKSEVVAIDVYYIPIIAAVCTIATIDIERH